MVPFKLTERISFHSFSEILKNSDGEFIPLPFIKTSIVPNFFI